MQKNRQFMLRKMTVTAVMTALAVVLKCFFKVAFTIPALGIQISFGGIFTFFPAALFGPIYGGVASALTDLLGALIAPTGAYIPWLTVTAFLGGFLKGIIWKALKKAVSHITVRVIASIILAIGILGVTFTVALNSDGVMHGIFARQADLPEKAQIEQMVDDGELSAFSRAAVSLAKYNKNTEKNPDGYRKNLATYLNLVTWGLEAFAMLAEAELLFVVIVEKKTGAKGRIYIRALSSVLISGMIVTTINTFILKAFVSAYAERAIVILWVPRACEEVIVSLIQAIIITMLYIVLINTPFFKYLKKPKQQRRLQK